MQDYTNVILYFPDSVWSQLMDRSLTFQAKANLIGCFATKLGLRNPSESTSQMITSVLLACPGGRDLESHSALDPQQLHQLFLLVKKEIRATISVAPPADGLPQVEKLPTQPQQLDPQWLHKALGEEAIGQCPLSISQVTARAVTIPMRSTKKKLLEVKKPHRGSDTLALLMNGLHIPSPQVARAALPAITSAQQLPPSIPCPLPLAAPCAASLQNECAAKTPPQQSAEAPTSDAGLGKKPEPQTVVSAAAMLQQQWQEAKKRNQEISEEDPEVKAAEEQDTSKEHSAVQKKQKPTKTDTEKAKFKKGKVSQKKTKNNPAQGSKAKRNKRRKISRCAAKQVYHCLCWKSMSLDAVVVGIDLTVPAPVGHLRGFSIWSPNGAIDRIWPEFAMRPVAPIE